MDPLNHSLLLTGGTNLIFPTVVNYSTKVETTGTSTSFPTPSGAQSGDILVLVVAVDAAQTMTLTGWSNWNNTSTTADTPRIHTRRLTLSGAPAANYTATFSSNCYKAGIMVCLRGASSSGEQGSEGTKTGSSGAAADCGSLTLVPSATMVFAIGAVGHGNNGPSEPSGFTAITRLGTGGSDLGVGIGISYKNYIGAQSTGTITTGNAGVSDVYLGCLRTLTIA